MRIIKIFFGYLTYWYSTMDERHLYEMGKIKGMRCTGYTRHFNGDRTYSFHPWEKPVKTFLSWSEWKEYKNKKATEAAS